MTQRFLSRGSTIAALALSLPVGLRAQATEPTVIYACYSPTDGSLYRIKAPGLPQQCATSKNAKKNDIELSWNVQGPAGPAGAQGASGPQGDPGPTGIIGPMGDVGPVGATGDRGAVGPQGIQGIAGPSGARGAAGEAGTQGSAGPTGPGGLRGDPGERGAAGPTGPQGDRGDKGSTGPIGASVKGDAGVKGDVGPAGLTGPTGPPGITEFTNVVKAFNLCHSATQQQNCTALGEFPSQTVSCPAPLKLIGYTLPGFMQGSVTVGSGSGTFRVITTQTATDVTFTMNTIDGIGGHFLLNVSLVCVATF